MRNSPWERIEGVAFGGCVGCRIQRGWGTDGPVALLDEVFSKAYAHSILSFITFVIQIVIQ